MDIRLQPDFSRVRLAHRALGQDQVPYATAVALTRSATRGQTVQREHMARTFIIRRPTYLRMAVKMLRATKRNLVAIVKIDPPGGSSDIFSKFEEGGTKTARDGGRLAIPIQAKRSKADIVTRANRPRAFNFRLKGNKNGVQVFKGDKRTFMIKKPDGTGYILQRVGSGAARSSIKTRRMTAGTRLLYVFQRAVKIDDRLDFEKNITEEVREAWPGEFARAFEEAVRTAR